jgi:hypothetical protein
MTSSLTSSISTYIEHTSRTRQGISAMQRWASTSPDLARFRSLSDLVRTARNTPIGCQDAVVVALARLAPTDQLAQLAVTACLSQHLGSVVSHWRRARIAPGDLEAMEADLVSACWEETVALGAALNAGAPVPDRAALALVDRAWHVVRNARRAELRAVARRVSLDAPGALNAQVTLSTAEQLSAEIAGAVRSGRISVAEAVPVFLTRVVGYSTAEVAASFGRAPNSVRAVRSRAERQLVA